MISVHYSYRAEMERINAFLAKADLKLLPEANTPEVVTARRHLIRYFKLSPFAADRKQTARFDLAGRLFGGWWQELPSGHRQAIRIDGEPIADLDFASMFLRLAYLKAGIAPPDGDLYATVRFKASRDTVKQLVSAMLFQNSQLARVPPKLRDALPPRISADTVRGAIFAAHPLLIPLFEHGAGLGLMFTESQILVAALLRLVDHGIPALPMHDGLIVARSKSGIAAGMMQDAAEQITGARLPITLK